MIGLRNARRDDAAVLAAIGLRAWEKAMLPIGLTGVLKDNARAAFEAFTRSFWVAITVAEWDGVAAGFAARENFDDKITDFWVDPPLQGRGVGSALLAAIEEQIGAAGFEAVGLETHALNQQAIDFFRRRDYAIHWLTVTYSPKLDRDMQSVGLRKILIQTADDGP